MNKAQLVQAVGARLGDRRAAEAAVDEVLAVIVRTVQSGEAVTLTGFGVFERRERAARTGRNPRTGEPLAVAATAVPAFRPGATFRGVVSGERTVADPPPATAPSTPDPPAPPAPAPARRRPAPTPTEEAFAAASAPPAAPTAKKVRSNGKGRLVVGAGKAGKGGKKSAAKGEKGAKGGKKRTKK